LRDVWSLRERRYQREPEEIRTRTQTERGGDSIFIRPPHAHQPVTSIRAARVFLGMLLRSGCMWYTQLTFAGNRLMTVSTAGKQEGWRM
jgi:hypothetical protein